MVYTIPMSKEFLIIILGVLVALLNPFLGFPPRWEAIFQILAGVTIAGLAFIIRQERLWKEREESPEHRTNAFVDNGGMHAPPKV